MVPIAHASDGGGSIRIPACNCGVFGLKVSRGRHIGFSRDDLYFSVRGAISRSVRDSARHLFYTQRTDGNAPLTPVAAVKKSLTIMRAFQGDWVDRLMKETLNHRPFNRLLIAEPSPTTSRQMH